MTTYFKEFDPSGYAPLRQRIFIDLAVFVGDSGVVLGMEEKGRGSLRVYLLLVGKQIDQGLAGRVA